jgi:hypothetical protein
LMTLCQNNNQMKPEEYPIKGKDVNGIDSNGNIHYCFRCNCRDPYCFEWRCSITGCGLMVDIVEWEYV